MNRPITVRLPDDLRALLDNISKAEKVAVSEIVRKSIRKYVSIYRFRSLQNKVLPFAEAEGLLTDDDVV